MKRRGKRGKREAFEGGIEVKVDIWRERTQETRYPVLFT